jgi:formamidopyrimidine-DNA glycosylase
MPELPELEVVKGVLTKEIVGKKIESLDFVKPYILKKFFPQYRDRFPTMISKINRRGKYTIIYLENSTVLVIHLMKSGRIHFGNPEKRIDRYTSCYAVLSDGRRLEVKEYGSEKMAKVFIVTSTSEIPGLISLGIEPLDPSFTVEKLQEIIHTRNKKLKYFLKDQSLIAGIGNAYSDEILWEARLSPFQFSHSLDPKEVASLHHAIVSVLKSACEEIKIRTKEILPRKEYREFLRVYHKKGENCPRCRGKIEWVYSKKHTIYYCPSCQTKGKIYKDRRLSHFLK